MMMRSLIFQLDLIEANMKAQIITFTTDAGKRYLMDKHYICEDLLLLEDNFTSSSS
jgi:hypothetical protein